MAIRLYNGGEGLGKDEIAEVLSVTARSVSGYLQDIDDQLRKQREEKMTEMWLACHGQQAIAEAVGLDQAAVARFLQELCKAEALPKIIKSAILHESDFEPQIYSVWSFPKANNEVRHFGNIPPEMGASYSSHSGGSSGRSASSTWSAFAGSTWSARSGPAA